MHNDRRIAIVGCYPPPYGGVGIGVKRLAELLESMRMPFVVYNTLSDLDIPGKIVSVYRHRVVWSLWYLLKGDEKVVILRTSNLFGYLLGALLYVLREKKAVIFVGNMVYPSLARGPKWTVRGIIMRWVIKHAYLIVGTSRQICETLVDAGADEGRVRNIAGFMLPRSPHSKAELPEVIQRFREQHAPVLLAMAFPFTNGAGQNVYGCDILLDAAVRLKEKHRNMGVLLLVPARNGTLKEYWPDLLQDINKRGLNEHVLPYLNDGEMYPFLELSDVFVRPTRTDGDANSIREAIHMKVPVLASDCAPRPDGTVTYPVEDIDACVIALDEMISNLSHHKEMVARVEMHDNAEKYIQLFRELVANSD